VDEYILNIVNAIVLSLFGLFSSNLARNRKKKILRNRLSKDGWRWRSFASLCNAIREDEGTTRELLIEIGARASTKRKDVWTLEDNG
jgi:hypothetical protein